MWIFKKYLYNELISKPIFLIVIGLILVILGIIVIFNLPSQGILCALLILSGLLLIGNGVIALNKKSSHKKPLPPK